MLIVMYETRTWRLTPGEMFTFGRAPSSSAVLPAADHGLSRRAGSFTHQLKTWWVHNDSNSSLLYLTGDLGFRVDLPPGMRAPLQQWHVKVRLHGVLGDYTLRLRLPEFDEDDEDSGEPEETAASPRPARRRPPRPESVVTSTHDTLTLNDVDRLVLAARFEDYLTWRHASAPAPRSAAQTADRIGWKSHTVAKRCENIRERYTRLGVPGLRGPRALEELARVLIATSTLTPDDLKRLPPRPGPGGTVPGRPGHG